MTLFSPVSIPRKLKLLIPESQEIPVGPPPMAEEGDSKTSASYLINLLTTSAN
jgi:hypothetical protein